MTKRNKKIKREKDDIFNSGKNIKYSAIITNGQDLYE